MAEIRIRGGRPLNGTVDISAAKNAALPMLAATMLAGNGQSRLSPMPQLKDVEVMLEVISHLGVAVEAHNGAEFSFDAANLTSWEAPYELVCRMRASILIMGPLLARLGKARVSMPGGCAIGTRPIDLHLKGFAAMGAEIVSGHGFIEARAPHGLRGARIYLDYPSVGATENIMTAAALAKGQTSIENAAVEPEIVNLAVYLNNMGAQVTGAGTDTIIIQGVAELKGADQEIIPDRIEAGTYMIGAALLGEDVVLNKVQPDHIRAVIAKLQECGAVIEEADSSIRVRAGELKALDVQTMPYPGFPTDMQPQIMALLTQTPGASTVTETVFENRFMHVPELQRMGASIKANGRQALVRGPSRLSGAQVAATDLRAGAALVLAGLAATGETIVTSTYHIDRGYVDLVAKFANLGADIERVE